MHSAEEVVAGLIPAIGGVLSWLTNTLASAVLGLIWGAILVAVLHLLPIGRKDPVH